MWKVIRNTPYDTMRVCIHMILRNKSETNTLNHAQFWGFIVWQMKINEVFSLAGINVPKIEKHSLQYGKFGLHTEYLGYLLAEMQHIPLLYPDAKW